MIIFVFAKAINAERTLRKHLGRHSLTLPGERRVHDGRLGEPGPPKEAEGRAMSKAPFGRTTGNPNLLKGRTEQKYRMGLFIRTIGIEQTKVKIDPANIVHNIKGLCFSKECRPLGTEPTRVSKGIQRHRSITPRSGTRARNAS